MPDPRPTPEEVIRATWRYPVAEVVNTLGRAVALITALRRELREARTVILRDGAITEDHPIIARIDATLSERGDV